MTFRCRVGVVPWLNWEVLRGWDCPIIHQLLNKQAMSHHKFILVLMDYAT